MWTMIGRLNALDPIIANWHGVQEGQELNYKHVSYTHCG